MTIILISLATFVATLVGGILALRFRDKLHLVLGFSAGAVIGVAFFDLLPEALELAQEFYESTTITAIVAIGFVTYLILDRVIFLHSHGHEDDDHLTKAESNHLKRGTLGAGSLSIHSFLDGVAIGLAFQVSTSVGAVVAVAVLVHDFSDGINTVGLILKNSLSAADPKDARRRAYKWLFVDALAPVLGTASTLFFTLSENTLSIILALFCGFFLYIGASDLIPESHHAHPRFMTTAMTLFGVAILFLAIHFAGV